MKLHMYRLLVLLLPLVTIAFVSRVSASEVTGTLNTGLRSTVSAVEGVVIVPPTSSPLAGSYTSTQIVTLIASGATSIRYTLDGSIPSCSIGNIYVSPISVNVTQTIKAVSCYAENNSSAVVSYLYTISTPSPVSSVPMIVIATRPVNANTVPFNTSSENQNKNLGKEQKEKKDIEKNNTVGAKVFKTPVIMFKKDLQVGVQNDDVKELQKILINEGLLKNPATGYFGSATKRALLKWQAKNSLPATGYFGPMTRTYWNKINNVQ